MNPVRKSLVTIFPAVLLAGSPVGLAGNCSITNGVAVGDCGATKFLEVTGSERVDKVIPGARVKSDGSLDVSGMVNGDVTVERGGYAVVRGSVNGAVVNNGGTVEIHGMVSRLQANGSTTTVHGIVQSVSGSGTVRYKVGAIVGGVRVERDR
jgi:hypothetical protein